MKMLAFATCALLALAGSVSARATTPEYTYVFVPSPPSSDWGGELFLDSAFSPLGGGSLSDINMSESWLRTPFGSFYLDDSTDVINRLHGPPGFTWNATAITSMDITGAVSLYEASLLGDRPYEWNITDSSASIQQLDPYNIFSAGQWVAAVPDSASTAFLLGLAAAALCGCELLSRRRPLAMARRLPLPGQA
jgi:hypothetical protein